ncbi:MAG: hypothetical protein AB8E82_04285 [Aureispira sp.]
MKRIHNWDREKFIAYDNSYIAEQDERGKIIAAEIKGKTEEKEGVVKRCWKKNMAVQDIAEIAGLSIEQVQEIIKR